MQNSFLGFLTDYGVWGYVAIALLSGTPIWLVSELVQIPRRKLSKAWLTGMLGFLLGNLFVFGVKEYLPGTPPIYLFIGTSLLLLVLVNLVYNCSLLHAAETLFFLILINLFVAIIINLLRSGTMAGALLRFGIDIYHLHF